MSAERVFGPDSLERIAVALERIAKTLEAIRSQCEPRTVHLDGEIHAYGPEEVAEAMKRHADQVDQFSGAW